MKYRHEKFVGKKLLALDLQTSTSPLIEAILEPDADVEAICKNINEELDKILKKHLGENYSYTLRKQEFTIHPRTGIIEDAETRSKKFKESFEKLKNFFKESDDEVELTNENDGNYGYWLVSGIRHSAIVRVSSAKEAFEKSNIESWESPSIKYLGESFEKINL